MTNPLLKTWETPYGLPPFAEISDADFGPAFDAAMAEDLVEVEKVATNPEPPTFENTIEGLMRTGSALDRVAGVFYNLAGADSNDAREALMRDYAPRLSAHSSAIFSNKPLFARIKAVWEARDTLDLLGGDGLNPLDIPLIEMRRAGCREARLLAPLRNGLGPVQIGEGVNRGEPGWQLKEQPEREV